MNEGKRPGGLTALAVINFVLGGHAVLSLIALAVMVGVVYGLLPREAQKDLAGVKTAFEKVGALKTLAIFAVTAVAAALEIIAGIGYLKQKRFLGRVLGNIYALTAIGASLLNAFVLPREMGGAFSLGTLLNLVYPLLTLILINTTFKEDLVL